MTSILERHGPMICEPISPGKKSGKGYNRDCSPKTLFIPGKLYKYVYREEWPVGELLEIPDEKESSELTYSNLALIQGQTKNEGFAPKEIALNQIIMFVGWAKNEFVHDLTKPCCHERLYFLVEDVVCFLPLWLFPAEIRWIFEGPL